ncbi:50S ribosomal protein L21e [archaeon]|nr:50S ribosomal protein L21e [archaeon]
MQKSQGKLRKHGRKIKRPIRKKGITVHLQEFKMGEKVCINIDSSEHSGMPIPKFQGQTAEIKGKQGKAYLVEIKDGNMTKTLIVKPSHLKR